jgi:enoyl-CoA hydratase/carnithine racemase
MPIRFSLADYVARVTIDRPEVLNVIDAASERELQAIWARIEADPQVRVVVLTGAGERAFLGRRRYEGGVQRDRLRLLRERTTRRFRRHRIARDTRQSRSSHSSMAMRSGAASKWRSVAI